MGRSVRYGLNAPLRLTTCFTGRIPIVLGQLTALTQLDVGDNELTGE